RYVRVKALSLKVIPDWHRARGRKSWLFVDEIMVNPVVITHQPHALFISGSPENDLYKVLKQAGVVVRHFQDPAQAISAAPNRGGVLVLAQGYPETTTDIKPSTFALAKRKKLRLYIEYPTSLPGLKLDGARDVGVERAVVADDFFGDALDEERIMAINSKKFIPVAHAQAHIVFARVAGFDTAVYGLPDKTWPALFEYANGAMLVSTTKLSNFVSARFAPTDAVQVVWQRILHWLHPNESFPKLQWTESVRASYARSETLPKDHEMQAIERGILWYEKSKLLATESMDQRIKHAMKLKTASGTLGPPAPEESSGNGAHGIMQCYLSDIGLDGKQKRSAVRRGDNQCGEKLGSRLHYSLSVIIFFFSLTKSRLSLRLFTMCFSTCLVLIEMAAPDTLPKNSPNDL
ncbi:MAG: hypothetical protein GY809_11285, partial [Planctomycetes bacterium]|nr:hypothetical protein [Planctomycetota bacterium]